MCPCLPSVFLPAIGPSFPLNLVCWHKAWQELSAFRDSSDDGGALKARYFRWLPVCDSHDRAVTTLLGSDLVLFTTHRAFSDLISFEHGHSRWIEGLDYILRPNAAPIEVAGEAVFEFESQRQVCEQRIPGPRRQFNGPLRGMPIDPLQHVDQVSVRIDSLQPARGQKAQDHTHPLCTMLLHANSQLRRLPLRPLGQLYAAFELPFRSAFSWAYSAPINDSDSATRPGSLSLESA